MAPDSSCAPAGRIPSRVVALTAFALGAAVLFFHVRRYYPFFVDDSFISLRYAERLAQGRGLTWNDGERVVGYSNLLWVLACAALARAGVDLVVAARFLGVVATLAAFVAVIHGQRGRGLPGASGGALAVLALALSGPIAIWSIGGLEQPLLAALLAWSAVRIYPLLDGDEPATLAAVAGPGVLLGLLAVTRPDTGLFAVVAVASVVALRPPRPESLRIALGLGAVVTGFALAQLVFRLAYYGAWVPNTALAKVAFSWKRVAGGLRNLGDFAAGSWMLGVPALGAVGVAAVSKAHRRRVVYLVASAVAWALYVLAVAGDEIFPAHRTLVPVVVLFALLLAEVASWAAARAGRAGAASVLSLVMLLLAYGVLQQKDQGNTVALATQGIWRGRTIGLLLKRVYGEASPPPLLAVDYAGVVPFYSELPSLDMLGLCDAYLAHHRPRNFGQGQVGHELGDGNYVLRRAPDILLAGINGFSAEGSIPSLSFRGGAELAKNPRFAAEYLLVSVRARSPEDTFTFAFVRREGKVGIKRAEEHVVVPGILFAAAWGSRRSLVRDDLAAEIGASGIFGTTIPAHRAAKYAGLRLAPGRWRAEAVTSSGSTQVGLAKELPLPFPGTAPSSPPAVPSSPPAAPLDPSQEVEVEVAGEGVDVAVVAGDLAAHLVEVRLSRVSE